MHAIANASHRQRQRQACRLRLTAALWPSATVSCVIQGMSFSFPDRPIPARALRLAGATFRNRQAIHGLDRIGLVHTSSGCPCMRLDCSTARGLQPALPCSVNGDLLSPLRKFESVSHFNYHFIEHSFQQGQQANCSGSTGQRRSKGPATRPGAACIAV